MRTLASFVIMMSLLPVARADEPEVPSSGARGTEVSIERARTIDLDEVERLASERNFTPRRARARADIARDLASEAKWRLVPSLSLVLGYAKVDGATQNQDGEAGRATFTTANPYVRVSYGINPVESYYDFVGADRRADAQAIAVRVAQREARLSASRQYFDVVQSTSNLAVADKALADAKEILRITEVLERQGTGKGDELARAKAGVAQAEQNRILARRAIEQSSIRLATTLDLEPAAQLSPDARDLMPRAPSVTDSGGLVQRALLRRPEIEEVGTRIDAARAEQRSAWSSLLVPTVEAYYLEGGLGPTYASLDDRRAYGALATWTVSATKVARLSTARARIRDSALEAEEIRQRVSAEVVAAIADAGRTEERLAPADQALVAAEDAFRIVGVRFRNGNAILVEVIAAQREVELARLNRVSAIVEHNHAQARLRIVLGE